ncbi:DinB family protein [Pontibacter fetidus]|uniref:DinB family protein n=1 Tax=Pontibacter fetidus TaxID=2700082 RepID=A0A6B2H6D6_9BACT|nr:DinB family protein [Pontibacter fetidus]NDK56356.1 DinB family protein [Pontibacter fetidus]
MALTIKKPSDTEFPVSYLPYVSQVPENKEVLDILEQQVTELQQLLATIDDARAEEAYAEGKWTIKELVQHMIDSERVFAYRALCFARGEQASLPGFDENLYAENSMANDRQLKDILDEYELVRKSNLCLFRSFETAVLDNVGTANNKHITLRGLIYVIAGHERHHLNILKERYLKQ